jgi:hypothetical protein
VLELGADGEFDISAEQGGGAEQAGGRGAALAALVHVLGPLHQQRLTVRALVSQAADRLAAVTAPGCGEALGAARAKVGGG